VKVSFPSSTLAGDAVLSQRTLFSFATRRQARGALTAHDDFWVRLSPFDRSARMKTDRRISDEEFLAFLAAQALPWPLEEVEKVRRALAAVAPGLAALLHRLPGTILLVKTTGEEECHSAYTRRNAIMLPPNKIAYEPRDLERLLVHELFHVVSRHNRALRERLYAAIGFLPCGEIELPEPLRDRRITNPDAPRADHSILVSYEGERLAVVPVIFGVRPYDAKKGELFDYLVLRLLAVEQRGGEWAAVCRGGEPRLLAVEAVSGFYEQVGRNAGNASSPEEILAENLTALVMGDRDLPSPEVVRRVERILLS